MTETRVMRVRGRFAKVDGYTCADCGVWGPYRQFHSALFCLLHKQGWTREEIIETIRWNARELGEETPQ